MLAIIQCSAGQVAGECQVARCFEREVVEVAPCSICREKKFCVVWEVELRGVLVIV